MAEEVMNRTGMMGWRCPDNDMAVNARMRCEE